MFSTAYTRALPYIGAGIFLLGLGFIPHASHPNMLKGLIVTAITAGLLIFVTGTIVLAIEARGNAPQWTSIAIFGISGSGSVTCGWIMSGLCFSPLTGVPLFVGFCALFLGLLTIWCGEEPKKFEAPPKRTPDGRRTWA